MSAYWIHARRIKFPLLQLNLLRIRTFGIAVEGGYLTRLGIGGVSFLLLLLCQVGLGFTPVQSGLLTMPQAAAVALKFVAPGILARFGYRTVLVSNALIIGIMLLLFATIGLNTAAWAIVLMTFLYRAFTSLQFTSMNTLAYADIAEGDTSMASSIFSTLQQMSISFGITCAGLATELFIPAGLQLGRGEMIHGIHESLIVLGAFTFASTAIFSKLESADGDSVIRQRMISIVTRPSRSHPICCADAFSRAASARPSSATTTKVRRMFIGISFAHVRGGSKRSKRQTLRSIII